MVISANPEPHKTEFLSLLDKTLAELNAQAQNSPKEIGQLTGSKLEPIVWEIMTTLAKGTAFDGSIELVGGQKFPDVVAKKYYGVEVKTTTKNHWKTTGNSVMESTRVGDVERIFLLFGKLASPIEFRCRPYEECLTEIVVTHSPRYLIDMNLGQGETIFDKLGLPYDDLRKQKNPIRSVTDYYKSKLQEGQDLWWIDQEGEKASEFIINSWSKLKTHEKNAIKAKGMAFFPEIFGNQSDKFSRMAIWLLTQESIVCSNLRDPFTAGGKGSYAIKGSNYENVPRIYLNLFEYLTPVLHILHATPAEELSERWRQETKEETKVADWIALVSSYSKLFNGAAHLDIKQMLTELA